MGICTALSAIIFNKVLAQGGVGYRMGFEGNEIFLASTWFNRFLMGVAIGLAGQLKISKIYNSQIRGALLGFMVAFSLYIATNFIDTPGFFAGIFYGVIIDWTASKYSN